MLWADLPAAGAALRDWLCTGADCALTGADCDLTGAAWDCTGADCLTGADCALTGAVWDCRGADWLLTVPVAELELLTGVLTLLDFIWPAVLLLTVSVLFLTAGAAALLDFTVLSVVLFTAPLFLTGIVVLFLVPDVICLEPLALPGAVPFNVLVPVALFLPPLATVPRLISRS